MQPPLSEDCMSAVHIARTSHLGSARWRFRRSDTRCGQGRGRTADLPLFRDEENRGSMDMRAGVVRPTCSIRA